MIHMYFYVLFFVFYILIFISHSCLFKANLYFYWF